MTKTNQQSRFESAELPKFSRILLVTDFSPPSIVAAPFAAQIANYYESHLVIAHVLTSESETDSDEREKPELDRAREAAKAQLQAFIAQGSLGETKNEIVIAQGSAWEALAAIIDEKKIDLVVLGTHGRSGVGKLLLGSVAQRIFSLAPCPVLTVSPKARGSWGPGHRLSKILYATDFSESSLKALPYALSLANAGHAELLLLHAPPASEASSPEIAMGFQQHLGALVPAEHRSWCKFDTVVNPGEAARAILNTASRNNVDVIVLGARAYEGSLAHFQVPVSVAYRVVAHATCPVLRVRS